MSGPETNGSEEMTADDYYALGKACLSADNWAHAVRHLATAYRMERDAHKKTAMELEKLRNHRRAW